MMPQEKASANSYILEKGPCPVSIALPMMATVTSRIVMITAILAAISNPDLPETVSSDAACFLFLIKERRKKAIERITPAIDNTSEMVSRLSMMHLYFIVVILVQFIFNPGY